MSERTAVILAAGLGIRMGPRGKLVPKGLIDVGGAPLVPQSVATLKRAGIDQIVIVTGHLQEQYQAAFAGSDVRLIHNPDYASTGSLQTLRVALSEVTGAVVLLESDLIYAPQILSAVKPGTDRFLVSGPTGAGDEVYTWLQPGVAGCRMALISKDLSARPEPPFGEMIGITCLSAQKAAQMRDVAGHVLRKSPAAHYEEGLVALAQDVPIECVRFDDVPWAEIDDEDMLARVRGEVWPKIAEARRALWGDTLEPAASKRSSGPGGA